jgi:hypothetical protein
VIIGAVSSLDFYHLAGRRLFKAGGAAAWRSPVMHL